MIKHDNINIDVLLVRHLINTQFPEYAELPIEPVKFSGWDNRTFHLGKQMVIRLPSREHYADQVLKEQYWLPRLAPKLSLPISTPLTMGKPCQEYPWHWSIYKWLDGDTATIDLIQNLNKFAIDLAEFLKALQDCDTSNGPLSGSHNFYRGGDLAVYANETQQAIAILDQKIDTKVIKEVWDTAVSSRWQYSPVWVHGDIAVGNLLINHGQLSAVIDFGCMGIGDPSCDLVIAWTLFNRESRDTFHKALNLDKHTWQRARGWAFWKALIVAAGLCGANAPEDSQCWYTIDEVLKDHKLKP